MRSATTELELAMHHETDEAWLVSDDGDEDGAVWLPKAHAERGERVGRRGTIYLFDVATWLARDRGLI